MEKLIKKIVEKYRGTDFCDYYFKQDIVNELLRDLDDEMIITKLKFKPITEYVVSVEVELMHKNANNLCFLKPYTLLASFTVFNVTKIPDEHADDYYRAYDDLKIIASFGFFNVKNYYKIANEEFFLTKNMDENIDIIKKCNKKMFEISNQNRKIIHSISNNTIHEIKQLHINSGYIPDEFLMRLFNQIEK